jgi:hypothetical protein
MDSSGPYGKAGILEHTDPGIQKPSLGSANGGMADFLP